MPRGRPKQQHTIAELHAMLRERQGEKRKLINERRQLSKRIEHLDQLISRHDGETNGDLTATGRPRNPKNLPDVLHNVLQKAGKPLPIKEIADGARGEGYHSSSANFKGIVNQALIKDPRFVSEKRGTYKLAKK